MNRKTSSRKAKANSHKANTIVDFLLILSIFGAVMAMVFCALYM